MDITYTTIREKVAQLKSDAELMLAGGISEMLKVYKNEKESPHFYISVSDLYDDYETDLFEADVISVFASVIKDYFNMPEGCRIYDDTIQAIKTKDLISFIKSLTWNDEILNFIKEYKPKEWMDIIDTLTRILTDTYWS